MRAFMIWQQRELCRDTVVQARREGIRAGRVLKKAEKRVRIAGEAEGCRERIAASRHARAMPRQKRKEEKRPTLFPLLPGGAGAPARGRKTGEREKARKEEGAQRAAGREAQ